MARRLGVPWGISESAYNARDLERTYQYSSFGVPGLGLKRGLGENTVVAPYATALAAMVKPHAAVVELRAAREDRCAGPLWLLRSAGLHRAPPAGRRAVRHRACLHGPPPGHDDRRAGQYAARRTDAQAISRGASHQGDRAAVAGADAARRLGPRCEHPGKRHPGMVRRRHAGAASHDRYAAPCDAAHASAVERSLRRDADGRRIGLQPVARSGGHALGSRRHLRRVGLVPSSCATSTPARSGRQGISRRASNPTPTR